MIVIWRAEQHPESSSRSDRSPGQYLRAIAWLITAAGAGLGLADPRRLTLLRKPADERQRDTSVAIEEAHGR